MRITPMLCVIAIAAPLAANAQQATSATWPLASGSRVRILSPALGDKSETGTLVSSTSESIVFQRKTLKPQSLGVGDITRMDVAQGTHARKMKGAAWGFLLGGAAAAGIAAATWKMPTNCYLCIDFGRGGDSAMAGALGGILGGIAGVLVGSRQTDTWVPVRMPGA